MQCARHPKVETALRCVRCDKPICPNCMISAPVGFRCRDCASLNSSPLFQVRPGRFVLAALAGLAAGTLAGIVAQHAFIFILFIAPMIGGLVGEVILRTTGRKRGPRLEFLAGASVVGGAVLSILITFGYRAFLHPIVFLSNPFFLLATGLAAAAAVTKIRYW